MRQSGDRVAAVGPPSGTSDLSGPEGCPTHDDSVWGEGGRWMDGGVTRSDSAAAAKTGMGMGAKNETKGLDVRDNV